MPYRLGLQQLTLCIDVSSALMSEVKRQPRWLGYPFLTWTAMAADSWHFKHTLSLISTTGEVLARCRRQCFMGNGIQAA
jgi:hypothetical protein